MNRHLDNSNRRLPTARPAFRILFIDHTAVLGGGEIALLNLIRHIDRRRFQPVLLLFSDGALAETLRGEVEMHILPLQENLAKTRRDFLGFSSLLRVKDIARLASFTGRVAKFIFDQKIDLVYTNSLKSDIIGGLAGRLTRRPVVWHVRDRINKDYLPKPVASIFRNLAKIIPTHLVVNSAATMKAMEFAARSRRSMHKRLTVVHDGTILNSLHPRSVGEESPRRIGLIGRICPWKGQDVFLRAAAKVRGLHPQIRFSIIGAALFGEEEYELQVRKLAVELGLGDVVEFTGFRSDIHEQVAKLDVVVHASTIGEPFGQVLIEAMAASKPVVATDGGGVPEIVLEGETGLLVPMGDPAAMANAISWMIENPNDAAEMGRKGRLRVKEKFTIGQTAKRVEDVLSGLLQRGRTGVDAYRSHGAA